MSYIPLQQREIEHLLNADDWKNDKKAAIKHFFSSSLKCGEIWIYTIQTHHEELLLMHVDRARLD